MHYLMLFNKLLLITPVCFFYLFQRLHLINTNTVRRNRDSAMFEPRRVKLEIIFTSFWLQLSCASTLTNSDLEWGFNIVTNDI